MHIQVEENKIILVGKAWEIKEKLKEYSTTFHSVQHWIDANRSLYKIE
ncbi:MAG: Z-ring formation inhibitor MciZ [Bacillus sp. (in: firmicutes)]